MLGFLRKEGFRITPHLEDADVVIINTCGFINDAKEESIETILELAGKRREGSLQRLVVAGCMAQAYARELLEEIPEIDVFVGLDELETIADAVGGGLDGHLPDQRAAMRLYDAAAPRMLSTGAFAYLKVAEGCNNPCAFCHIPKMRGAFRSRSIDDIVAEARRLDHSGVHEINLIAQDTTRYGEDLGLGRSALKKLIEKILRETDIPWLRFLYAYPSTLDEEIFDLMAAEERFLSYLDIPFQHVDRKVLKAMRRGGNADNFRRLIEKARTTVPDICIRTTMIVGFPFEDEEAFGKLEEFIADTAFDHLGVFAYSWQEENPGADLGDPVPEGVKVERMERLMALQQGISARKNSALVGRRYDAIVEGPLPEMELLTQARLRRQAPEIDGRLLINDGDAPAGSLVEVEICEAHPYDLIARSLGVKRPGPARLPLLGEH